MRTLLSILAFCTLAGCTLPKDPSVTVNYASEFCASMLNENGGTSRAYFSCGEGSRTWTEDDLEPMLGELKNLEVQGIKVLKQDLSNDYGNLTVTIDDGNQVVAEKTAPKGTERAIVKYSF